MPHTFDCADLIQLFDALCDRSGQIAQLSHNGSAAFVNGLQERRKGIRE